MPDYGTRLHLALESVRLGDPAGYSALLELIEEAADGSHPRT
jgi:hypothetical protein